MPYHGGMRDRSHSGRGLRELVGRLRRGLVTEDDADEFLSLARTAFDASAALLIQDGSFANWNRQAGVPGAWPEHYVRYGHQDFSVPATRSAPLGTWYLARTDSPPQQWDTDLADHFAGVGLDDMALARLYAPYCDELHVVLYRARDQPRFSEDDRTLLELLYPHMAGALAARRALAAIEEDAPRARGAAHAWLSLPSRRVVWTEAARTMWRRRVGTIGAQGWRRIEQALFRAVDRFATAPDGGRSQLLRADLRVELAYVPPEPGEEQRILALFTPEPSPAPADETPRTPAEELLSPVQLAIARATAGGRSAKEIAHARGITEETVRTHLKAIHTKLGTSRALLATLVTPDAPPRRH